MFCLRGILAVSLAISGCAPSYGGPHCTALSINTPLSSIPEFDPASVSMAADTLFKYPDNVFLAGSSDIACCARSESFTPPAPQCAQPVDCEAYVKTLRQSVLGGKYRNEVCGPNQGAALSCTVVIDEADRIVGVKTYCYD